MKKRTAIFSCLCFILVAISAGCNKMSESSGTVADVEGNIYNTVRIGTQVWMAENLRTTLLSDGTSLDAVQDAGDWSEVSSPAYCWYDNDEAANRQVYGALYNYYSVSTGKLCPEGWHVPTLDEWQILGDELADTLSAGGQLKETGTGHWNSPNTGATNSSGFTALPAGLRYFEGTYNSLGYFASFWSFTEEDINRGWYSSLYYADSRLGMNTTFKRNGFSVRCLRNK